MRVHYKESDKSPWKHLQIRDLSEVGETQLWRKLETFSGVSHLRWRGRYCVVSSTRGQAQSLCKDALYYMQETKSFKGVITYQNKGGAQWRPDEKFWCTVVASLSMLAWVVTLSLAYVPIWFPAILSYVKYRQTK